MGLEAVAIGKKLVAEGGGAAGAYLAAKSMVTLAKVYKIQASIITAVADRAVGLEVLYRRTKGPKKAEKFISRVIRDGAN